MSYRSILILAVSLVTFGCGGEPEGVDSGPDMVDAGVDAAVADAGPPEVDWSCLGTIPVGTASGATHRSQKGSRE